MKNRMLHKSRGVALVTAIFLLVVLAGLAVAVVSLTTTQQANSVQDEQGARAYQAAKAGMEWALYQKLITKTACPAATFAMPGGTSLSSFTVTVMCENSVGYDPANASDTTAGKIRLTVTACNGASNAACPNATPGPDYIQRVLAAQL